MDSELYMSSWVENWKLNCQVQGVGMEDGGAIGKELFAELCWSLLGCAGGRSPSGENTVMPTWMIDSRSTLQRRVW